MPESRLLHSRSLESEPSSEAPEPFDGASAGAKDRLPNGFMSELKKFYYDLAGAANPGAVASLLKLVTTQQILFGTDFPPGGTGLDVANTLVKLGVFSESDLRAIDRENAVRLLPRFKV